MESIDFSKYKKVIADSHNKNIDKVNIKDDNKNERKITDDKFNTDDFLKSNIRKRGDRPLQIPIKKGPQGVKAFVSTGFDKIFNDIHDDKYDSDNDRLTALENHLLGLNGLLLENELKHVDDNERKSLIDRYSKLLKLKDGDNKLEYLTELNKLTNDVVLKIKKNRAKLLGIGGRNSFVDRISKRLDTFIDPIEEQQKKIGEVKKELITKLENLKGEVELFSEINDVLEAKLKKINLNKHEEDDIKISVDESKKDTNETKTQLGRIDIKPSPEDDDEEEEEEEEEEEKRITKVDETTQRDLVIQKLSKENNKRLGQLTNVGKQAIIGTSIVGLIGTLAPYVPKTFQAIRGVPMKKKRTKDDLILLQQTGIDTQKLDDQKRTIDNLNRRLDNIDLQNREKSINKYTLIGQQNRLNRVAINNIRGKKIRFNNRIKMHNITKRKIFNV